MSYFVYSAIIVEVVLFIFILFNRNAKSDLPSTEHRKSLLCFIGVSSFYLAYQAFRFSNQPIEILDDYATGITFWYVEFIIFFHDALFGFKAYKVPYVWIQSLVPVAIIIGMRWYCDHYQNFTTSFYSWSELNDKYDIKNMALLVRCLVILFMLFVISLSNITRKNFNSYRLELKKRHKNVPDWMFDFYMSTSVIAAVFFVGCAINYSLYHILSVLLLVVASIAFYIIYRKDTLGKTTEVEQIILPSRIKTNYIGLNQIDQEIERLFDMEPFPLADQNINQARVARHLNVKNDDFSYYLNNIAGVTFYTWLNRNRLEYCTRQLHATDLPLGTIALSAGYNDLSAMSKAFKRKYSVTPSDYRKGRRISR